MFGLFRERRSRSIHAYLELARSLNLDSLAGLSTLRTDGLDFLNDVHALGDLAEDNVLSVLQHQGSGFRSGKT